jgi:hypothetical protein
MKKTFEKTSLLLTIICMVAFTSCYKKYDYKDYQPVFTVGGYASSSEIGAGHLVGYWGFEGTYADSISNTVGTGVNTSFATGFLGKSLQGAANGYVISDLPAAIKNMHSFTIDFWINTPQNTSGIITPICISNEATDWGALDLFYENGSTASSATFKAHINGQSETWFTNSTFANPWGAWQNIALTYDAGSSTFTTYQGGGRVSSATTAGLGNLVFPATANNIIFGTEQFQTIPTIGTMPGGAQSWADFLRGSLDEVRIYDVALSEPDLKALIILQGKGK